jgi:trehalose 6-phosphate phosphatase
MAVEPDLSFLRSMHLTSSHEATKATMKARAHRMPHLFSPEGQRALAAVLDRSPLLGFDFDGTLAPIVRVPGEARVPLAISHRLRSLAARLPIAVVSGRSLADVAERLDFEARYVVGNHGAEISGDCHVGGQQELDVLRALLQARDAEFRSAGVIVEDKGMSLALHYRLARRPQQALAIIHDILQPCQARLRVFAGKMVVNVVASGAPDKADAVLLLLRRCGASCAVFFGDDVNDEPVFASAPDDWVTVRVGRDNHESQADFFIAHPSEMAMVLDGMLLHLNAKQTRT